MKKIAFSLTLITLLFLQSVPLRAQEKNDTTVVYQVETTDGNVFAGRIISKDDKMIVFKTENLGLIHIPFKNVKSLKEVKKQNLVEGELWPENPHASRYFYSPNGYGLKKGEGYYQNTWVLFNQLSYGITSNFSMGAGLIPIFLFGADGAAFWFTPKLSFPIKKDKLNIGAGAIMGTYLDKNSTDNLWTGMAYGVSTFGSIDRNFTAGAGFAFAGGEWASTPVFSLGGVIRTGKHHYLLTENYFFVGKEVTAAMIWLGGRFASRHLAIDYGGIIPVSANMSRLIIIPWLSITVPFGVKQKVYIPSSGK